MFPMHQYKGFEERGKKKKEREVLMSSMSLACVAEDLLSGFSSSVTQATMSLESSLI